jgi:hypothetical protein
VHLLVEAEGAGAHARPRLLGTVVRWLDEPDSLRPPPRGGRGPHLASASRVAATWTDPDR